MKRLVFVVCLLLLVGCSNGTIPPAPLARATAAPARAASPTAGVPNTSPAAGAALVEQAVGLLLDQYVEPLRSGDLYAAALAGAVDALRASGATPQAPTTSFSNDPRGDQALFQQAYLYLAQPAGTEINQTVLAYEAIGAVVKQVDECHTAFLDPATYQQFTAGLQGQDSYAGIGVVVRADTRPVVIGEVFPGTPADQSGLRPGDAILEVDGRDVSQLAADQLSALVRGPEGTTVTLTIQRPGEPAPRDVRVTRARIAVPTFTSRVVDGPDGAKVGYMRLYEFADGTDQQVQAALADFERQGAAGWVLDLRDNPGGVVDVFARIASRFVAGRQPLGYVTARGGQAQPIESDPTLTFAPQRPLAVLVDGGSASSSEAFAAAAQDLHFAHLVGQTTAGCLAEAQTFPLADGSALEITLRQFVSPQKRQINRVGVTPDEVVQPDPTGATDPVLDAALRWATSRAGAADRSRPASWAVRWRLATACSQTPGRGAMLRATLARPPLSVPPRVPAAPASA